MISDTQRTLTSNLVYLILIDVSYIIWSTCCSPNCPSGTKSNVHNPYCSPHLRAFHQLLFWNQLSGKASIITSTDYQALWSKFHHFFLNNIHQQSETEAPVGFHGFYWVSDQTPPFWVPILYMPLKDSLPIKLNLFADWYVWQLTVLTSIRNWQIN